MSLLHMIEQYLRNALMTPIRFGLEATGDPRFAFDLRRGREPRAKTEAKVRRFISQYGQGGHA